MPITEAPTLRETVEAAYDSTVGAAETAATDAPVVVETAAPGATTPAADTDAGRARDASGRFIEADKEKPTAAKPVKAPATAAAPVEKIGVKRPDSWKKELWPIWEKLDAGEALSREERKQFLEYLPQREGEYAKGVSAYKAEADHAKALRDAIAPYQPMLQQTGMRPEQFISSLANTHQTLTNGTPEQKLRTFAKFAQDYQIPLNEMLIQGEDGKVYLNQEYFKPQQPQGIAPEDVDKRVVTTMQKMMWANTVQNFVQARDKDGNPLYPHYEKVKGTMDGLLRAGLFPDLPSAYGGALRLPQHADLYEAEQKQLRDQQAAAKLKEEADKVARARANAASPRTSTPTASVDGGGKKGLRDTVEAAYDQHIGGRI